MKQKLILNLIKLCFILTFLSNKSYSNNLDGNLFNISNIFIKERLNLDSIINLDDLYGIKKLYYFNGISNLYNNSLLSNRLVSEAGTANLQFNGTTRLITDDFFKIEVLDPNIAYDKAYLSYNSPEKSSSLLLYNTYFIGGSINLLKKKPFIGTIKYIVTELNNKGYDLSLDYNDFLSTNIFGLNYGYRFITSINKDNGYFDSNPNNQFYLSFGNIISNSYLDIWFTTSFNRITGHYSGKMEYDSSIAFNKRHYNLTLRKDINNINYIFGDSDFHNLYDIDAGINYNSSNLVFNNEIYHYVSRSKNSFFRIYELKRINHILDRYSSNSYGIKYTGKLSYLYEYNKHVLVPYVELQLDKAKSTSVLSIYYVDTNYDIDDKKNIDYSIPIIYSNFERDYGLFHTIIGLDYTYDFLKLSSSVGFKNGYFNNVKPNFDQNRKYNSITSNFTYNLYLELRNLLFFDKIYASNNRNSYLQTQINPLIESDIYFSKFPDLSITRYDLGTSFNLFNLVYIELDSFISKLNDNIKELSNKKYNYYSGYRVSLYKNLNYYSGIKISYQNIKNLNHPIIVGLNERVEWHESTIVPRNSGNITLNYQLDKSKWLKNIKLLNGNLFLSINFYGQKNVIYYNMDSDNSYIKRSKLIEAVTTLDLGYEVKPIDNLSINLYITNLSNNRYVASCDRFYSNDEIFGCSYHKERIAKISFKYNF